MRSSLFVLFTILLALTCSCGGEFESSSSNTFAAQADDGTPTRVACTDDFGSKLNGKHGRLDGFLVSIVKPGKGECSADSDHVHLQVKMNGSIYDVAVNVASNKKPKTVDFYEGDGDFPGGSWSEGWHTGVDLDYVKLGIRSTDFAPTPKRQLVAQMNSALEDANHVSIFATGYGRSGVHLVHRRGSGDDGAIVLRPLSANPHLLLFRFDNQSF